jgi:tRNA pseudouridine55 synthase
MTKTTKKLDNEVLNIFKPIGISPLDLIKALKNKYPQLRNQKMTYAGRLDPMARGVVLIVKGSELKNFHSHLKYDKEYEAKILLGFSTDTYDILGLSKVGKSISLKNKKIKRVINSYQGSFTFQLPPFSGYNMKGKPLFQWALEGKLDEIEIPTKTVKIKKIKIKKIKNIKKEEIKKEIKDKINRVVGDFRQKKILKQWRETLKKEKEEDFKIITLKINSSSGFYVRSFAHILGEKLGSEAVLFDLIRTKVGKWTIKKSIQI